MTELLIGEVHDLEIIFKNENFLFLFVGTFNMALEGDDAQKFTIGRKNKTNKTIENAKTVQHAFLRYRLFMIQ